MNLHRKWLVAASCALLMAGCSTPDATSPATGPATTTTTTSGAPATAKKSDFCRYHDDFQRLLVIFKAKAGAAMDGERLDFEHLKALAANLAQDAERMQPSAPPEIADQFRTVVAAVATSASNLKEGARVRDVVEPLYGEQNRAAFEAVQDFEKPGCTD